MNVLWRRRAALTALAPVVWAAAASPVQSSSPGPAPVVVPVQASQPVPPPPAPPGPPVSMRPPVISRPEWTQRPTVDDLSRFYPASAMERGLEGRANVVCEVMADGTLSACVITAESPPDAGFGNAALRMATRFRMRPMTADGQPVAGGKVMLPIRFTLDEGAAGPRPPLSVAGLGYRPFPLAAYDLNGYADDLRRAALRAVASRGPAPCTEAATESLGGSEVGASERPRGAGRLVYLEHVRVRGCGVETRENLAAWRNSRFALVMVALPSGESQAAPRSALDARDDIARLLAKPLRKICRREEIAAGLAVGPVQRPTVVDRRGWTEVWPVKACGAEFRAEVKFVARSAGRPARKVRLLPPA